jgi:hypothetical protein
MRTLKGMLVSAFPGTGPRCHLWARAKNRDRSLGGTDQLSSPFHKSGNVLSTRAISKWHSVSLRRNLSPRQGSSLFCRTPGIRFAHPRLLSAVPAGLGPYLSATPPPGFLGSSSHTGDSLRSSPAALCRPHGTGPVSVRHPSAGAQGLEGRQTIAPGESSSPGLLDRRS